MSEHDARHEHKRLLEVAREQGGALMADDAYFLRFLSIRLGTKIQWQRIEFGFPSEIKEGWHGG